MDLSVFGSILKEMYSTAPEGETVAMIHLFGIKHAADILRSEYSAREIAQEAGINTSYGTEINKGVKLAKYVLVK